MSDIQKVTIIGCGSIGASWAALFLASGLTVSAFDINPAAETFLRKLVGEALPVLADLGLVQRAEVKAEDIIFTTDLATALQGTQLVQQRQLWQTERKTRLRVG